MKKKERFNKVFGSFILVMVFQLVFTAAAFAYAPVSKLEVGNSGLNPYDVQDIFIPGDVQKIITEDFTMGDTIFIEDKTGEIYNVDETKPRASCIHNFVSGTKQEHIRFSDGSCRTDFYDAERCSMCGEIRIGDKINSASYDVCPH